MFQIGVWNQLLQLDVWRFLIANCESWRCMRHTIADNRTWGGTRLTSPPTWTNNHYYWGFQKSMVAYKKQILNRWRCLVFHPKKLENKQKAARRSMEVFFGGITLWIHFRSRGSSFKMDWQASKWIKTRWWFQIFLMFTPKIGEDEPNLTSIFFQRGWIKPPENGLLKLVQSILIQFNLPILSWLCEVLFPSIVVKMMFGLKHYVSSKTSRCPFRDVFFFESFKLKILKLSSHTFWWVLMGSFW